MPFSILDIVFILSLSYDVLFFKKINNTPFNCSFASISQDSAISQMQLAKKHGERRLEDPKIQSISQHTFLILQIFPSPNQYFSTLSKSLVILFHNNKVKKLASQQCVGRWGFTMIYTIFSNYFFFLFCFRKD